MFRFIKSKFFLVLEIIVLVVTITAFVEVRIKERAIKKEIGYLSLQQTEAIAESEVLSDRLDNVSQDSYIELQAKRKLHYKKPQETVFVFYEDARPKKLTQDSNTFLENNVDLPNPVKWWKYFFN